MLARQLMVSEASVLLMAFKHHSAWWTGKDIGSHSVFEVQSDLSPKWSLVYSVPHNDDRTSIGPWVTSSDTARRPSQVEEEGQAYCQNRSIQRMYEAVGNESSMKHLSRTSEPLHQQPRKAKGPRGRTWALKGTSIRSIPVKSRRSGGLEAIRWTENHPTYRQRKPDHFYPKANRSIVDSDMAVTQRSDFIVARIPGGAVRTWQQVNDDVFSGDSEGCLQTFRKHPLGWNLATYDLGG
ncbi:hypothetical protein FA15DRAFT_660317 [Coprinopsis marcescibilis]|uniref:Uncharacterized protein n=1 Tax=Coprinopsis marcescibilis TaxID=230819 RepID=A0A5C3KFN0_COPMA|nr:hypothetical protein FA15DRAFT_660317 [Coprinopsis marcescibilis]